MVLRVRRLVAYATAGWKPTPPPTGFDLAMQLSHAVQALVKEICLVSATVLALALDVCCLSAAELNLDLVQGARQTLVANCVDCHSGAEPAGGLSIAQLVDNEVANTPSDEQSRLNWWKILQNVRAGTMPPLDGGYHVDSEEAKNLLAWVKYVALEIDPDHPDPGRVTVRRLNRREYSATIRDLMGVDFDASILFPADDTGYGFDNIGDTLSLSPLLLEKYLSSAVEIVRQAVPQVTHVVSQARYDASTFQDNAGDQAERRFKLDRQAQVICAFTVPQSGDYRIALLYELKGSFLFSPQRARLRVTLNGQPFHDAEYGWDQTTTREITTAGFLEAGKHTLAIEIIPVALPPGELPPEDTFAGLQLDSLKVQGPTAPEQWTQHPDGYERFFPRSEPPSDHAARMDYAREILQEFTLRAFRRPCDEQTMDRLLAIVDQELTEHKNAVFEQGIATAMTSILASPRFLFRTEELATGPSPEDPYPLIDEYALASRLSYFLWSSMPDDQLLRLAENNELRKQLTAQVKRMLADPKSQEFIRSFVGQWLRTQDVEQVSINSLEVYGVAREWDELRDKLRARESTAQSERENNSSENGDSDEQADWNQIRARLRELGALRDVLNRDVKLAMRQETEMLVETIVRENRDLIEIVNPGYSFLNERLAKLYGIEGVKGDEMRRVELPRDSQRGGILTQGTLLTVTSNPTRTSPVKRGLYVLENILATPTLPAPPNVPELEASQDRFGGRTPTLKELLAVHRESPLCASCHSRMDPLGLALENFNAVGAWRNDELGTSIEPAGRLVTGESFANIQELRELIAGPRKYDFYRCLSQKLLTYALGRGLEYYDEHTIDQLVAKLEAEQGTFQSLLLGIVESVPFQRQRPELTINTSMSPE